MNRLKLLVWSTVALAAWGWAEAATARAFAGGVLGADAAPAGPPAPAPVTPPPSPASKDEPLEDLDDLLGLPSERRPQGEADASGPAPADDAGVAPELDPSKVELDRKLTAQELADRFRKAVAQMGQTADRIQQAGDVGIVTQRLQEEILTNLELIIKQSQQGQGGGGQSGSSKSSPSPQEQQQNQQQSSQKPKNQQGGGSGDNRAEMTPPGFQPPEGGRVQLDVVRAAWGSLPERVRDTLLQGSSDYFSSLYESMTEAYYKRLAEEAQQP